MGTPAKEISRRHDTRPAKWDELVQEDRLHRDVYTDPEIFREEMTKIFAGTWVYLGHESEIPNRHDFKKVSLGTRPIILTRDGTDQIHGLFNRCSHRAATVCRENSGSSKLFRCGYHGWTFDSAGNLVGVPYQKGYGAHFDAAKHHLGEIPFIDSYRGLIFGTLNADAPALLDHLGTARPLIDRWFNASPTGSVSVQHSAHRMVYRGNWKLAFDNGADGYHPPFSHRSMQEMTNKRYGPGRSLSHFAGDPDDGPMYQQVFENGHTFADQVLGLETSIWEQDRPTPGGDAVESYLTKKMGTSEAKHLLNYAVGWGMNLNIFPNLLLIGNQIQVIEPLSVNRTQLTWYATTSQGLPDEINTLRMRMQEDFPNFGEPDDQANFEECQRGLEIPELQWIDISRGLGSDRQYIDQDGILTAPITDELQLRSYFHAWKRYMSTDVTLKVSKEPSSNE